MGYVSIRVPVTAEEVKERTLTQQIYRSVVSRPERERKCYHLLIGPLAFANAACEHHANASSSTFTSFKTNVDINRKNTELKLDYGNGNTLCTECRKEKERLQKLNRSLETENVNNIPN